MTETTSRLYDELTAPPPTETTLSSREAAARLIYRYAYGTDADALDVSDLLNSETGMRNAYRRAASLTRPNKEGGDAEKFKRLQAAKELLAVA